MDFRDLPFDKGIRSEKGCWHNVIQRLGHGRNAVTYLVLAADGPHQGILFALKIFNRLESDASKQRFIAESQFLQACNHPAIMRLYDTGTYIGELNTEHPFIVAEYLPETLEEVIRSGRVGIVQKVSFALNLVSALAYLETCKPPVLHRDIKPANVFVKGKATILGDFGLLKMLHAALEFEGEDGGSDGPMPHRYRTPDLVEYSKNGTPLTSKSDVFQLGLVLAELFFGSNPEKPSDDLLSPVELNPLGHLPDALGAQIAGAIMAMLKFDPTERPSATELVGRWRSIFRKGGEMAINLEGRVL